ncbi:TDT family transporter [Actinoplanes subglobosus]|uniref:TDT family transporter n=1 Tax=Actinoplanes subglobosus TaxID=1547892 RepID=A0ABV8J126_9ACTN
MTPNWYASVMGTGIVATAAVTLPVRVPGLHLLATGVWMLAAVLLIMLTATAVRRWQDALGHHTDPVMMHFYGAPPMAVLTVGAGTLLLGRDVIGLEAAVRVDWLLWGAGTIAGLYVAVAIPFLMVTRPGGTTADGAFGGWLMPVVVPMVSASTGALLVPYTPAGQLRLTMVLGCYAMFGISLIASLVIITQIWQRLVRHGAGPARMVPTLWIVLGPLGQSVTAANLLGDVADQALPGPYANGLRIFGVLYGVPLWGFALLWAALAAAVTLRTDLPFSPAWWSFTFPVGTLVTATSGLAVHTGADLFRVAAVLLYSGLLAIWTVVAARTVRERVAATRPAGHAVSG